MPTKIKIVFAAIALLSLASTSPGWASDNSSGDYHGGFVMPDSIEGVNPTYHPDLFASHIIGSKAYGYASGRGALASTTLTGHYRHIPDSRNQFTAEPPAAHLNGHQIEAPPWSFACMTDHGPSNCREPMWVYGDVRAYR